MTTATEPVLAPGESAPPEQGTVRFLLVLVARVLLAFSVGLVLWAVVPLAFGWHSNVILSDSMAPRIMAGDVVLSAPADAADVDLGQVVLVENPARPGTQLMHRAVDRTEDGSLITKGDANLQPDSTPVPAEDVLGIGRLRVMYAGLPFLWLHQGAYVELALFLLVMGGAIWLVATDRDEDGETTDDRPDDADDADGGSDNDPADPDAHAPARVERGGRRAPTPWTTVVRPTVHRAALGAALIAVLLATQLPALAAFAATTKSPSNYWEMSPYAQFGPSNYPAAVAANSPWIYYRLNETTGTNAADASGNGRTGTYSGGWTLGLTPGPLPREANTAVSGNGTDTCIYTPNGAQLTNPPTFSYEVWFRTTTTEGGKILGFEKSRTGSSTQYDRHLYMQPNGALTYGVWTGSATTITTPLSYNDGIWHQAVVTQGAGGMRLYVDGFLVVSSANTNVESYSGWWRVGCGNLNAWPASGSTPGNAVFSGRVDEVSIYLTQLTATDVRNHFFAA